MSIPFRWGILGTGNIANQFAKGLAQSRHGVVGAVGSRTLESARRFADQYKIPAAHGSYEALVKDPTLDAVYNSLPNSLHAPWTIAALKAGKHVICEKPIALNAAEAEQMFDVASENGKVLMEAFMYRSTAQMVELVKTVRSGIIGQVRLIRTSFCYDTRKPDGNVRFVRELGGGGLMDIGCYCINFSRTIAGAEPISFQASARFHPSGIDELVGATMVFPGGVIASFNCGMCVGADNTAHVCGSNGYIEVPVPWKPGEGTSRFVVTRGIQPKMDQPKGSIAESTPPPRDIREIEPFGNLYGVEADEFVEGVREGKSPQITRDDSLGNMRVLDEMRRQIGLKF